MTSSPLDVRHATHPAEFAGLGTDDLRARFLVPDLFDGDGVRWVLTHHDRMLLGGLVLRPGDGATVLEPPAELRADSLLERREMAVVGLAGQVEVTVGDGDGGAGAGGTWQVAHHDVLYVGQGAGAVSVSGEGRVYLVLCPAHRSHPTTLTRSHEVEELHLGDAAEANVRVIRKHVHADGTASCQLVLGITELAPGSVWNTMPAHVHDRRTEVYLYTDLGEGRVVHLAGPPEATRSIVVADGQAVVSPSWSVHCGAGTRAYSFVWAMAGENIDYTDVDPVAMGDLR